MVLNLFNQTVTPSYFYKRFVPLIVPKNPQKKQPQLDLEVKPHSSRKDAARQ